LTSDWAFGADFIVHGDDIATDPEGNDCYAVPKKLGKFLECKRTEGISTTALIQRLLHPAPSSLPPGDGALLNRLLDAFAASCNPPLPILDLASSAPHKIFNDVHSHREIITGYVSGSWDCFGAGHVEQLRRARKALLESNNRIADDEICVRLVVGIWTDEDSTKVSGEAPLLFLQERALSVIQCLHTDAIVLSAPQFLSNELRSILGIDYLIMLPDQEHPKDKFKIKCISLPSGDTAMHVHTASSLRSKIQSRKELYEERQRRKGCYNVEEEK